MIDRLLDDAHAGRSAVLIVRGEAGIGKTALLRYAAERASRFDVVHVTGVEAEMELPFAGIQQLCATMLGGAGALPAPQEHALRVALGLAAGKERPDGFLIGLAVLGVLAARAEERPLLCLVEDAQWLDSASTQVLGFVARRLVAESVAIVVAVRAPAGVRDLDGVPEVRLEGLDEADARTLLTRAVAGRLEDRIRDRIVAETRGNPLALLELPRGMSAAQLAGGFDLPVLADVSEQIEGQYARRAQALPEATRTLLLLAAAEPAGDAALVWRAARASAIDPVALSAAQTAELLEIGADVRFRHPLVRSAVCTAPRRPATAGARTRLSPRRPMGRRTPIGARGIAHWRPTAPTRTPPPTSCAPRYGRRRAEGSPRQRRSSSERPR
jgi:hypothetical protein